MSISQRPLLNVAIANDGWLRGWKVCILCSANAAASPGVQIASISVCTNTNNFRIVVTISDQCYYIIYYHFFVENFNFDATKNSV